MSGGILILGSTDLTEAVAHRLHNSGTKLAGIMSAKPVFEISYRKEGMLNSRHCDMTSVASQISIPHKYYADTNSIVDFIRLTKANAILAAGWHHIIPKRIRSLLEIPCLGLHASLLPRYRGGAPLNWALLNGDEEAGVTVFELADGVDAGPIFGQKRILVTPEDDIGSLVEKAEVAFLELLHEIIPGVISGEITPYEQEGPPSYSLQRFPEDGHIKWEMSAQKIARLVRATTRPYPGAYFHLDGIEFRLWKAAVVEYEIFGSPGQIASMKRSAYPMVVTGKGVLELQEVTMSGGNDAIEFLRKCHNQKIVGVNS